MELTTSPGGVSTSYLVTYKYKIQIIYYCYSECGLDYRKDWDFVFANNDDVEIDRSDSSASSFVNQLDAICLRINAHLNIAWYDK